MDIGQGKETEHETIINILDTPGLSLVGGQPITSPTTSTTMLNQQQSLQTSTSSVVVGEREKTVFDNFREIKIRNEILNNNTYTQFCKQTSSS